MNSLNWRYLAFAELDTTELYEILSLRQKIFVVEQNCAFLDADGYDLSALHLLGIQNDRLIAYARVLPPGVKYPEYSIGRLVVDASVRKSGLGRAAMFEAIRRIEMKEGSIAIRLQAQEYLAESFYKNLGFTPISEIYDEDGIPHVDMRRPPIAS